MYIVWHFENNQPQVQGVFDNEKLAQEACVVGDCYHFIKLNKIYVETIESSDLCLYKCTDGKFKTRKQILFAEVFGE